MEPARSIGKLGFRRWYERQLVESHAWLVTCFLCMLGVAASLEGFSFRAPGLGPIVTLVFVFAAGCVGWYGWRRYRALMEQAERIGDQSTCGACGLYGRFKVESEAPLLRVCCRKCGNSWTIE